MASLARLGCCRTSRFELEGCYVSAAVASYSVRRHLLGIRRPFLGHEKKSPLLSRKARLDMRLLRSQLIGWSGINNVSSTLFFVGLRCVARVELV